MDSARRRGATPYAEISGWGLGSSPAPPTAWPANPRGFLLTLDRALRMAGAKATEIDLVQAAANGGRDLDGLEAAAYERLFGSACAGASITSLKGATGEVFASGGVRTAALALSLRDGIVPPVVGLKKRLSMLPFVAGTAIRKPVHRALLSGISFGGTYACLVLEK